MTRYSHFIAVTHFTPFLKLVHYAITPKGRKEEKLAFDTLTTGEGKSGP